MSIIFPISLCRLLLMSKSEKQIFASVHVIIILHFCTKRAPHPSTLLWKWAKFDDHFRIWKPVQTCLNKIRFDFAKKYKIFLIILVAVFFPILKTIHFPSTIFSRSFFGVEPWHFRVVGCELKSISFYYTVWKLTQKGHTLLLPYIEARPRRRPFFMWNHHQLRHQNWAKKATSKFDSNAFKTQFLKNSHYLTPW